MPLDFSASPDVYLNEIASAGSPFQSLYHKDYFLFAIVPNGLTAGSAVPAMAVLPTTAHDGFLIAQAYQPGAHIYAADLAEIQLKVTSGDFLPLQTCATLGCFNLRLPNRDNCAAHVDPPLAHYPFS